MLLALIPGSQTPVETPISLPIASPTISQQNIRPTPESSSPDSQKLDRLESKIDQLLGFSKENLAESKKIGSSISSLQDSNHANAMLIVDAINSAKSSPVSSPVASEIIPVQEDEKPKTKTVTRTRTEYRQVCRGNYCEMVPVQVEYQVEVPIDSLEIIPIPDDGGGLPIDDGGGLPIGGGCDCGCGQADCNCGPSSQSRRFGSRAIQACARLRGRWLDFRSRLQNLRVSRFNLRWGR